MKVNCCHSKSRRQWVGSWGEGGSCCTMLDNLLTTAAKVLRKVKKSHLKLTKKTKLKGGLAKRQLKKLKEKTRKKVRFELDDDTVPLLETTIETPHSPIVSDDEENAIAGDSSMEPQSATNAEEPSGRRKKRRKRKVAAFAQEVAPLLKSDSDVSDLEQPKSILKRRRLENDGFFSKSKGNKNGPYNSSEQVDEKREKNREARRMRRQKRKVCSYLMDQPCLFQVKEGLEVAMRTFHSALAMC